MIKEVFIANSSCLQAPVNRTCSKESVRIEFSKEGDEKNRAIKVINKASCL
jgi:hypothetical protein